MHHKWKEIIELYGKHPMENHRVPTPDKKFHWKKDSPTANKFSSCWHTKKLQPRKSVKTFSKDEGEVYFEKRPLTAEERQGTLVDTVSVKPALC